jgi:murein DD-endopeptidase MepM/ murein hydrolase activator NlpD
VRCAIEIDAVAGAVVMAVHDGVVETVERDSTGREEGRFVRITHRGGAIASSYFQLDGIREDLRPGVPIKAGEPIGTVARAPSMSTRPHLRFAMSVSNTADSSVLFIDPQPLLALWPVRQAAPMSLRAMEHSSTSAAAEDRSEEPRSVAGRAVPTK